MIDLYAISYLLGVEDGDRVLIFSSVLIVLWITPEW